MSHRGVIAVTRLTEKYQATVPLRVRKLLNLKSGDYVVWAWDGDAVTISKG